MPSQELVSLTVDGQAVEVGRGRLLLDVLRSLGKRIPTLCHDVRLTPFGGCRLCVVMRHDGRGGLIPSCSTPVLPGMIVETDTPEVIESRRYQLRLLLLNHRLECPVCERRGDCRLQDLMYEYGVPERPLPFERAEIPRDEASPVILRDTEKCILCGKCVRLCDEVQGVAAIAIVQRGLRARVTTLLDRPLDCEFCGQCVNACPVGALVGKPYVTNVPAWLRQAETTTCSFCSCGCQIVGESSDRELVRVAADDELEPNHGKLCVKGWLGLDVLSSGERLTRPMIRRDGTLVETSWNDALGIVTEALRAAGRAGSRVVGIGSSRLATEDAYLLQRLLRAGVGTPHVGLGPGGGTAALSDGMAALTGTPRSSASIETLREADVVLVLRGDPTRTHPLVKTELVQGASQRGQELVLAHALSGGLERHAALFLPLAPAGEAALLHGVAARLAAEYPETLEPLRALSGVGPWIDSLLPYTPDVVERLTGVAPGPFDALITMLRKARKVVTVVVTGLGIPGDEAEVTRAAAAVNALLGPAGGGLLVLGERANLQGALDVGLHPAWLPGGHAAEDSAARQTLARAWGHEVPPPAGIPTERAIHAVEGDPGLGVLYLVGQDPVGAWPGGLRGSEAVARAGLLVVQDAFMTQTARLADVVLPVAILSERSGSVVSADGVRRALRPLLQPPPGVPQDGQIFREIGRRLGVALPEGAELEAQVDAACRAADMRPVLRCLVPAPAPVLGERWTGLLLDASPQLFRSGSVTDRSSLLQELAPSAVLRLSPRDAEAHGVRNGDAVRLTAGGREALLRARVDTTVRTGTVLAPWHARWDSVAALMTPDDQPLAAEIRRSS
jgi:predicted molibdopterin-dependent oxidoreductase YjgC